MVKPFPAILTPPSTLDACPIDIDKTLAPSTSTNPWLCGEAEVGEEGLHLLAQGLVMSIDPRPGLGLAALAWFGRARENRLDHLLAQHHERSDDACPLWADFVAARAGHLVHQALGPQ